MELFFLAITLAFPFALFRPKDFFQPEFFINFIFIFLIGLGPIVLFFFKPEVYLAGMHEEVVYVIILGYLSINLGFLSARIVFGRNYIDGVSCLRSDWNRRKSSGLLLVGLCIFLVACFSGGAYFMRAGQIPIFAENKELARVAAMSVSGNGYLLYIFTLGVMAPAFILVHCLSRKGLRGLFSPVFLTTSLLLAVLLLFTGSRRYSVWLFVYVLGVFHYSYRPLPVWRLISVAFIGLLFVNIFEMFRNPYSETTESLAVTFLYRFLVYGANLEKVFSIFFHQDAMLGSTFFMDVMTILPGRQIDYQSWLKELAGLDYEGFGLPPTIMGDLYVNFGFPGIFIGCLLVGLALRLFYIRLVVHGRSGLGILAYISVVEVSTKMIMSGISAQSITVLWMTFFYSFILFFMASISVRRNI